MKVAILVVQFPPRWLAGTEIATHNLARSLSRRGHEIHVITKIDRGFSRHEKTAGFHLHRVIFPTIRFFGVLIFWIELFRRLKKINPQLIHVQMIDMGVAGVLAKKILNKNYLVYCRGSDVYKNWPLKKVISKHVFENASAVVVLTEDMKNEIGKTYKGEILVIPNGIEIEKYSTLLTEKTPKKNGDTVLYVGSLRPVKGVKYLIKAMKLVVDRNPNTKLIIVGDGVERENLIEIAKDLQLEKNVIFKGKIPNEEIPKYMLSADVFVLPSLSEGFPNVILEAMASGLPVVCSNVGGLKEIIKDGENGLFAKSKNVDELGDKIITILNDDELRKKMANNNLSDVKNYSWEYVVDRIEQLYSELI